MIACIAAITTVVIHYKATLSVLEPSDVPHYLTHCRGGVVIGILARLGLSIVANFQAS